MKRMPATTIVIVALLTMNASAAVRTGLDNLAAYLHLFENERLGVIANQTSRDRNGRHVVDVLQGLRNAKVTALFSPEHGLDGAEEAGKAVGHTTHPDYGLPVYSLYGETKKPTTEMLRDVDVLVFDMQDVGARFYTYIYTMSLAMEAAAENYKKFIVLDRPNPINGTSIEGPILDRKFAGFVGLHPIPVRHGMTVGELARLFNEQGWLAEGHKAELVVIPMHGWSRRMWYDETELPFIKPSPNIPNLATAIVYPGLCLLEGTNETEGLGPILPFRQFGAPWINAKELAIRLNELDLIGARFIPASFIPSESKHKGRLCHGAQIIVSDRRWFEPFFTGIQIVNEIRRAHPEDFEFIEAHFDRLCGTASVREAILAGDPLKELYRRWSLDRSVFQQVRSEVLMYSD